MPYLRVSSEVNIRRVGIVKTFWNEVYAGQVCEYIDDKAEYY